MVLVFTSITPAMSTLPEQSTVVRVACGYDSLSNRVLLRDQRSVPSVR